MGCSSSKNAKAAEGITSPASLGTVTTENARGGGGGRGGRGAPKKSASQDSSGLNDTTYDDFGALVMSRIRPDQPERLYKLLARAQPQISSTHPQATSNDRRVLYQKILEHIEQEPAAAQWTNPTTGSTPLHMACRLVDVDTLNVQHKGNNPPSLLFPLLLRIIDTLMASYAGALRQVDVAQNIPLHYAIAPSTHFNPYGSNDADHVEKIENAAMEDKNDKENKLQQDTTSSSSPPQQQQQQQQEDASTTTESSTTGTPSSKSFLTKYNWKQRALLVQHLMAADQEAAIHYLSRNDLLFESGDATGGCTPLYRALQTIPDDFDTMAPTVDYIAVLHTAYPYNAGNGNASDGDKPLSLLYRRFTRQFDISEQFFAGDNSRPQVVQHRQRYKTAAGNTWKLIELLLKPTNLASPTSPWGIVHCAVQVETPPDLLRYIVETNAQDLTRVDPQGNLPLHYAAAIKPPTTSPTRRGGGEGNGIEGTQQHYPAFYNKYVMDELLYKFPEAAGMADAKGQFPLTLAVTSGKQWIGGGIKSLYDAYPDALQQLQLDAHPTLLRALSMGDDEEQANTTVTNSRTASTQGGADEDESMNADGGGGKDENDEPVDLDDDVNDDDDDDDDDGKEDSKDDQQIKANGKKLRGVVKDEQHDAIMLVQQPNVTVEEVTTSMWAHEEDAGVQMLGCVAISNMLRHQPPVEVLRIALTGTASVVNAMKAHPNELIVQEKACLALQGLASADGHREVSMVASGAVAAIVGAMQAHVGDAGVQEQACRAVAAIVKQGGADRATVVASVSGVTAILNALAAHAHVVGVQVAGLQALEAMTQFPNANLPELPRAQTEPLLMSAQETFPEECSTMVEELVGRMST